MVLELPKTVDANIHNFTGRTWLLPVILHWLEQTDDRLFILTGDPGTGKSMIIAWLGGAGPAPAEADQENQLARIRAQVKGAHFCLAKSGNTAPKAFAQHIAEQLTCNVKGFSDALVATLADRVQITVEQHVDTVKSGGNVTGVAIGRLDLGALGDELSFDRTIREPLMQLYKGKYEETTLILVDALDEALTYTGSINIVQLLAKLTDLPKQVRFLVTTRNDPRVLFLHHEVEPFDLIDDATDDADDVRLYAYERLAGLNDERRTNLASGISQAAEGKFLYAHLVLNELIPHLSTISDPDAISLPAGLSGLYQDFLNRELGANRQRWFDTFKPLLGLIAVAQGKGLNRSQIERITKQDVEFALETSKQYLDGELPQGPFRPFHKSFTDFLLEEEGNSAYHIDASRMHRQIADHYWSLKNGAGPWRKWDDYGLRYIAAHLTEAARGSSQPERSQQTERLVQLVVNRDFQQVHKERVKDLTALQRDLEQALRAAASDSDSQSLRPVIESALALVVFRREELRPEPLFALARAGEVEDAVRRLNLFDVEPDWRQAALLTIAWLSSEVSPGEARKLRDRIQDVLSHSEPLPLLMARLNATLEGAPLPALTLPAPPPDEVARAIVGRMGGEAGDAEMLMAHGFEPVVKSDEAVGETGYLAEQDGPPLVAFAAAYPDEGEKYFSQYLSAHTNYSYVEYRNRSLWWLLRAVLHHPDQTWARIKASELAATALAGSVMEFQEGLPLTILALQAAAGDQDAIQKLEQYKDQVLGKISVFEYGRKTGDTWGSYKRQLAALALAFLLLPRRQADVEPLLDKAQWLPYGFAGFQTPACLTLAEAIQICLPWSAVKVQEALEAAERAAHNIQDGAFCARSTARVNAMRLRWWTPAGFDVAATINRLCEDSSTPEFTALHKVGEEYKYRDEPEALPLPPQLRQAKITLKTLAEVYHRPLGEFQRLNREQRWAVDQELEAGTLVNIPDPGFATWLAARFSAAALVDASLSVEERVGLIQSLAPVAAINSTTLDTVLSRLLLAARPIDARMLDELAQTVAHYTVKQSPESVSVNTNLGMLVLQNVGDVSGSGNITGILLDDFSSDLGMLVSQKVDVISGTITGIRLDDLTSEPARKMEEDDDGQENDSAWPAPGH